MSSRTLAAGVLRAVIYARVSSRLQRDAKTIKSQLDELPGVVERQGWTLARPVHYYVDDGRTAKAGHLHKRKAFMRLLADARAGEFDVVVVVDLDRITRSEDLAERGQILGALQVAGVRIYEASTGQLHDPNTAMGDAFLSFRAVMAADENRKRRERSLRARARSIREGHQPSGRPPWGWTFSKKAGWALHPDRAKLLNEIRDRILAGEACYAIGHDFSARGIEPPHGGRWETAVYYLAIRPVNRGLHFGGKIPVPPIWDDVTFYAVQNALRRNKHRGLDQTRHVYLLQGIAVCGLCGGGMWCAPGCITGEGVKKHPYYSCPRRRMPRPGQARCLMPSRNIDDADAKVWAQVLATLGRPDVAELAHAAQAAREQTADAWRQDLAEAERRRERLAAAEKAILRQFSKGLVTEANLSAELAQLARERAFADHQVAAARAQASPQAAPAEDLVATIEQLRRRALRMTDPGQRQKIVRALVERATVMQDGEILLDLVLGEAVAGAVPTGVMGQGVLTTGANHRTIRIRVAVR